MPGQSGQHARQIIQMVGAGAAVHSQIVASWGRCIQLHKLDPETSAVEWVLTGDVFRVALELFEPYLELAEPELQNLTKHLAKANFFLSVADSQGVILTHRGVLPELESERWRTQDGVVWRENIQGTNAIGTGLFSASPTAIYQEEHFYGGNAAMTCLATPLYGPAGNMLGALNIATLSPHFERSLISALLALLVAASQRIESLWFQDAYQHALVVTIPSVVNVTSSVALVAVDLDLNVIGATHAARQYCKITDGAIEAGLLLNQVMSGIQPLQLSLAKAERAALQRALLASGRNVTRAARQLGISRATMNRKMVIFDISRMISGRQKPK